MKRLWLWLTGKDIWEYGTLTTTGLAGDNSRAARRHMVDGNVQFVLWKAGEQGHKEDFWINYDSSWWRNFKTA